MFPNVILSKLPDKVCSYYVHFVFLTRGGGVLDQWLGIGVPLRVSNPDPV